MHHRLSQKCCGTPEGCQWNPGFPGTHVEKHCVKHCKKVMSFFTLELLSSAKKSRHKPGLLSTEKLR